MKFYFVVVVTILVIYQVGCVGPNQIPAPQQPPCVIGQQPIQQVPLVQAPPPPHVWQQWPQPPPYVIGQQPFPQQVPPIPVQQVPHCPGQQSQSNYISPQLPQPSWPQQPCNTIQQPPFNPQYPVMTFPHQPGANHLEQNMLPQSYPPQYPQPYPPPPGYPQQPGAHPGGYYPPVPGAYSGGCYPPVPVAYPGLNPVYPANPAGSSCPNPSGQQHTNSVDSDSESEEDEPATLQLHVRRYLVWCTCSTCKDVVPIILRGNTSQKALFGKIENPNEEGTIPLCQRIRKCDRPKVNIALCNHKPPCNIVRKILMLFF